MAQVECCGQLRDSRFCPDCGVKLVEDREVAINMLAAYVLSMRNRAQTRLHTLEQFYVGQPKPNRYEATHHRQQKLAHKWQTWYDALQHYINLGVE